MGDIKGFTLLEVLFALFILAFMLMSLDALQLLSLQKAKINYQMAVAENQLQIAREKLYLNNEPDQLSQLNQITQQLLPNSNIQIDNDRITLSWGEKSFQQLSKAV